MTTWTPRALELFENEPHAEDAAAYASELIGIYAETWTDWSDQGIARAAAEIAEETSISWPATGANDTASREAIYTALKSQRNR